MCMLSFIFTNYKNNRGQGGFIANVCALAMYVSAYAKMAAARSDWLHPLAVARIGGLHSSNLYITSLGVADFNNHNMASTLSRYLMELITITQHQTITWCQKWDYEWGNAT